MEKFYDTQIAFMESQIILYKNQIDILKNLKCNNNLNEDVINEVCKSTENNFNDEILKNDDQDNVWDRIKEAHLKNENVEKNNIEIKNITDENNNIENKIKDEDIKIKKNIIVNKFSKFTNHQKMEIMSKIFKNATENVNKMKMINKEIENDLEDSIQKEADRLLEIYLDKN